MLIQLVLQILILLLFLFIKMLYLLIDGSNYLRFTLAVSLLETVFNTLLAHIYNVNYFFDYKLIFAMLLYVKSIRSTKAKTGQTY